MSDCFKKTNAEFIAGFKYIFGTARGYKDLFFGIFIIGYLVGGMIGLCALEINLNPENKNLSQFLLIVGPGLIILIVSFYYLINLYSKCNPVPKDPVVPEDIGG